jgi:ABC-type sugar transport system ATPase subunit
MQPVDPVTTEPGVGRSVKREERGETAPLLRMAGVCKRFPGVVALDDVSFELRAGEVHALLGQNGAGKSTLVKILVGEYEPTAGTIELDGSPQAFASPRAAHECGIAIVHQELSLLPNLSVTANICVGDEARGRFGLLDRKADERRAREALALLGADRIDPSTLARELSLAERQIVEIARALMRDPRILVLDEPTASLSPTETERLFELVQRLRANGIAVVFITHRLQEIAEICDRATVLRNGRVVATEVVAETSRDRLIDLILGDARETAAPAAAAAPVASGGEPALSVRGLRSGSSLLDASFEVRAGEIYGLTGLLGAGQDTIARALFGVAPLDGGEIRWKGEPLTPSGPRGAIGRGVGFLPEDRRGASLFGSMSVRENMTLPTLGRFARGALGPVSMRREHADADRFIDRLGIVTASPRAAIGKLSGGNQQKVLLARWVMRASELLVLQEPTHGVDVGARREIHGLLRELAGEGRAIVVVSVELQELLAYVDRIGVMHRGRLAAEFPATVDEATLQRAVQGEAS